MGEPHEQSRPLQARARSAHRSRRGDFQFGTHRRNLTNIRIVLDAEHEGLIREDNLGPLDDEARDLNILRARRDELHALLITRVLLRRMRALIFMNGVALVALLVLLSRGRA